MQQCKTRGCDGTPEYVETRVVGETTLVDIYHCHACHRTQQQQLSGSAWVRFWMGRKKAG